MDLFDYLPYVLKKKISKTAEARSGADIYKRRNKRDYRVLVQYKTWNKLVNYSNNLISFENFIKFDNKTKPLPNIFIRARDLEEINELINRGFSKIDDHKLNILPYYENGYAVIITPEEYFGQNYPNPSSTLNSNFKLGKTGFVLYTTIEQYKKFEPLEKWEEVFELSNKGYPNNTIVSWVGDFVLSIKNTKPQKLSTICGADFDKEKIKKILSEKYLKNIDNLPEQKGLGNYDYDYASSKMIELVKKQMLYLCLRSKTKEGKSASEYFKENYKLFSNEKDTKTFLKNLASAEYFNKFTEKFQTFEKECLKLGLLDFEKLHEIGAWNKYTNTPTCPLCFTELYIDEFFETIEQMEGREVVDNTQKQIVLMHIEALQPGELNHTTYNLGWGHHFCNTVQGDKSISETLEKIKMILENNSKKK